MRKQIGTIIPAILSVALFAVVVFWFILPQMEMAIMANKREMIRELTRSVCSLLEIYERREKAGQLTLAEAQARALEKIKGLRYGPEGKDYFWVNDLRPYMIMHPYRTDLEGKDISGFADPKGKHLFSEFVKTVKRKGSGYVDYYWQWKDDPKKIVPKISYVELFKPWGWIVGTGIYLEDVQKEMGVMTHRITLAALGILGITLVLSGWVISRSLSMERKRAAAEKARQDVLERYRAVLQSSPDPMVVYDKFGRALYINQAFVRVFGWEEKEILGGKIDFVPRENVAETRGRIEALYNSSKGYATYETHRYNRQGNLLDVIINAAVYRDPEGDPVGMVVNLTDITERKRAEEALKESEKRFRELAELLPGTIFEMDTEGTLTFVNRNALAYFGFTQEELLRGVKGFDLIAPEDRPRAMDAVKRTLAGEDLGLTEYRALKKDGSTFPALIHSSTIYRKGKPVGLRGFVIDITEKRLAEEEHAKLQDQLRQTQKMEALGILAGGIAHDFNNILTAIIGYSDLALEDAEKGIANTRELEEISKAGERAKDLVDQILTFSRKREPDLKPIDLNQVVLQTNKMMERMIPKMIGIEHRLAPDLLPVNADFSQFSQVLMNMGTNARDAMEEGGQLVIETKNVTLDTYCLAGHPEIPSGSYVQLKFSDTGKGMDKETLQHIFDPFFTTKEVGKGSGLGLATVYGIVKNHEGYIICESQVGQGTVFTIYLPAMHGAEVPEITRKALADKIQGGDETIMLVDDEEAINDLGRQILSSQGYHILTAGTGEEAVEVYRKNMDQIDLVILDISMPGMGGYKCLQEILRMDPRAKVIISSGYSFHDQPKDTLEAGFAGHLHKPYRVSDMLTTVREVLDG